MDLCHVDNTGTRNLCTVLFKDFQVGRDPDVAFAEILVKQYGILSLTIPSSNHQVKKQYEQHQDGTKIAISFAKNMMKYGNLVQLYLQVAEHGDFFDVANASLVKAILEKSSIKTIWLGVQRDSTRIKTPFACGPEMERLEVSKIFIANELLFHMLRTARYSKNSLEVLSIPLMAYTFADGYLNNDVALMQK